MTADETEARVLASNAQCGGSISHAPTAECCSLSSSNAPHTHTPPPRTVPRRRARCRINKLGTAEVGPADAVARCCKSPKKKKTRASSFFPCSRPVSVPSCLSTVLYRPYRYQVRVYSSSYSNSSTLPLPLETLTSKGTTKVQLYLWVSTGTLEYVSIELQSSPVRIRVV